MGAIHGRDEMSGRGTAVTSALSPANRLAPVTTKDMVHPNPTNMNAVAMAENGTSRRSVRIMPSGTSGKARPRIQARTEKCHSGGVCESATCGRRWDEFVAGTSKNDDEQARRDLYFSNVFREGSRKSSREGREEYQFIYLAQYFSTYIYIYMYIDVECLTRCPPLAKYKVSIFPTTIRTETKRDAEIRMKLIFNYRVGGKRSSTYGGRKSENFFFR